MPDPAPVSVDTPNVLDLRSILVTVRTDFLWRNADGSFDFHWISGAGGHVATNPGNGEPIAGATVELLRLHSGAILDTAITDASGQAFLETSQLPDGNYTVQITPKNWRNQLAGPEIAEDDPAPLPDRMYHPLEVAVSLAGGLIDIAVIDADVAYASLGNRIQPLWPAPVMPADHLPIDLKPIWMRKVRPTRSRTGDKIQMIVVHNTDGSIITGTINTFTGSLANGAQYVIDLNGHVIKFVKDHDIAVHAGGSWHGKSPNDIGIGIEVVHKEGETEYSRQQYASLIDLLNRLVNAYSIDPTQITGHSDVGTRGVVTQDFTAPDATVLDGHRDNDPGQVFQWGAPGTKRTWHDPAERHARRCLRQTLQWCGERRIETERQRCLTHV